MRLRGLPRQGRDETGGVLVFVAFWAPIAVLFMSFVLDVGHWFEHKRHLQLQADAAALAAAGDFRLPCADDPIVARAHEYGGETYNAQVGAGAAGTAAQDNVHMLINSRTFYNQSSPTDGTVNTSGPCAASMIDVKLTDTDVPWFFRAANVPFINAHSRIEIRQVDAENGALPIAVPDVNPKVGRAYFVNETTGAKIGSDIPLSKTGTANGLAIWQSAASGYTAPAAGTPVGLRVALGGGTSTTCGDPLVECYDLMSTDVGTQLVYVRSWSSSGTVGTLGQPLARDARLFFTGGCSDPYFEADAGTCTIGLRATVDIGPRSAANATMTASVGGTNYPLTFNAGTWQTSAIRVAPNSGPIPITLNWAITSGQMNIGGGKQPKDCKTGNGNPCTGSFGVVQRTFSATDARSGPIKVAQILESGVSGANSFQEGTTHDLVVKIGVKGSLENAKDVNDPIVSLRVVGNRNQSLDCDDGYSNLWQELAFGCRPQYAINTGTACPNQTDLWNSDQPWSCVAIDTGHATNEVPKGLNTRILGDEKAKTCIAPNHWSDFPNLPAGDPRIVQVFLTPYGSFAGSGSNYTVPVENFATFYVTGWTGQGAGFDNPCQGQGDDPVPNNDPGVIVGHFIKYIQTINNGGGSQMCDLNAFGSCVAVLTY